VAKERQSGESDGDQSMEAAVAEKKLLRLGFLREGCSLGKTLGHKAADL
jgi:hypothetical protein